MNKILSIFGLIILILFMNGCSLFDSNDKDDPNDEIPIDEQPNVNSSSISIKNIYIILQ